MQPVNASEVTVRIREMSRKTDGFGNTRASRTQCPAQPRFHVAQPGFVLFVTSGESHPARGYSVVTSPPPNSVLNNSFTSKTDWGWRLLGTSDTHTAIPLGSVSESCANHCSSRCQSTAIFSRQLSSEVPLTEVPAISCNSSQPVGTVFDLAWKLRIASPTANTHSLLCNTLPRCCGICDSSHIPKTANPMKTRGQATLV